jgi:hypothetical protein
VASPHQHPHEPRRLRPVPAPHASYPPGTRPGTEPGTTGHPHEFVPDLVPGLVPGRRVVLTPVTAVELKPTYWLWDGRIPAGAITLGPGREGIGKSLFCAWLTAQVSTGALPGVHHHQPRGVIYAATEDSWERTIAGRLHAAQADLARVFQVQVIEPDGASVPVMLPRDCDQLAELILAHDVGLVVLDPLISTLDYRINPNQDRELRRALEPLAHLADHTGAAVFGLAHFNKSTGTDALSRVTGSRAFAAVARAALAFARDPDAEDGSCVISLIKNNLGRLDVPSLRYVVDSVELPTTDGTGQWGRLRVIGETDTHVEAILNQAEGGGAGQKPGSEGRAALDWLQDYLAQQGGTVSGAEAKKAGHAAGFSQRMVERAHEDLTQSRKVVDRSEGFPRRVLWSLS